MDFSTDTNDATGSSFHSEAVVRHEGRDLDELTCVRILWSKGILFSGTKGRARKESPIPYLEAKTKVPSHLKFVVLTRQVAPGNHLW